MGTGDPGRLIGVEAKTQGFHGVDADPFHRHQCLGEPASIKMCILYVCVHTNILYRLVEIETGL